MKNYLAHVITPDGTQLRLFVGWERRPSREDVERLEAEADMLRTRRGVIVNLTELADS